MHPVKQIVIPIVHVHINVVRVIPSDRPWVIHSEPESAVLEARISAERELRLESERMAAAEIRAEICRGNSAVIVRESSGLALRRRKTSVI